MPSPSGTEVGAHHEPTGRLVNLVFERAHECLNALHRVWAVRGQPDVQAEVDVVGLWPPADLQSEGSVWAEFLAGCLANLLRQGAKPRLGVDVRLPLRCPLGANRAYLHPITETKPGGKVHGPAVDHAILG